jgi:hypothetical protein
MTRVVEDRDGRLSDSGGTRLCGLVHRSCAVYCTREFGHEGEHIATVGPYREGARVLARWEATR